MRGFLDVDNHLVEEMHSQLLTAKVKIIRSDLSVEYVRKL